MYPVFEPVCRQFPAASLLALPGKNGRAQGEQKEGGEAVAAPAERGAAAPEWRQDGAQLQGLRVDGGKRSGGFVRRAPAEDD